MANIYFSGKTSGSSPSVMITGAKDQKVEGYGNLNGNGIFGLSQTSDGAETVFDVSNYSGTCKLTMDSNDENYCFTGYNFDVTADKKNGAGYNWELNTANSKFDLSKSNSCAFIFNNGYNTSVALGSTTTNYIGADELESGDGLTKGYKYYNNVVYDNGIGNVYTSNDTSVTRFQTTEYSQGVTIQGSGNDAFFIAGSYGTISGMNENNIGYNYINTASTSVGNLFFGGLGDNRIDDFGSNNAYAGLYSYTDDSGNAYTNHYINFNGQYGLAAVVSGKSTFSFLGGSYNAGFTGATGSIRNSDGTKTTYNFADIANSFGWSSLASIFETEEAE